VRKHSENKIEDAWQLLLYYMYVLQVCASHAWQHEFGAHLQIIAVVFAASG
jgi:hypothetical protein